MGNGQKEQNNEKEIMRQRYLKLCPFNSMNDSSQLTACVGTNGGYNQSTIYEGFNDAVRTLIGSISEYKNYSDSLVYPILFCIRHSIELFLKDLYGSITYITSVKDHRDIFLKYIKARKIESQLSQQLNGCDSIISKEYKSNNDAQHKINKIQRALVKKRLTKIQDYRDSLYREYFKDCEKKEFTHNINSLIIKITNIYHVDTRIKEMFDTVLPLLNYYKDIDPNGDAFRYWSNKEGKPNFETKKISTVKIDIIAVQFEEMTKIFSKIDWLMWYLRKEYNTGTFTKDLSRAQLKEMSKLLPSPDKFSENIKGIKDKVKKKYNISSNKFDDALKIIKRHREFSSYMGKEKVFSCLSNDTIKIFVECALGQRNWKEGSSRISLNELSLLFVFSDIIGWRYSEKGDSYFSEDLQFLYLETRKKRRIGWYDINPISEVNYIIQGMKKCGQITYATLMAGYVSRLKE